MKYNFDEVIDRRNTDSLKYDFAAKRGLPEGILPLWVADMDFKAPDCIIDALVERSKHGIFGYTETLDDYNEILKSWFKNNFDWKIEDNWLIKTPGIVYAISAAIRGLTEKGDAVLIQQPVYYPFEESIVSNERTLVVNRLVYKNGSYIIDSTDFERKIIENNVKLFVLCNPHNPVGRVWKYDELARMGEICLKHNIIVVSDEIHADFIYPNHKHIVFSSIKPEFQDITITCTSPSKTFNLAGLQLSNIFIPNRKIRQRIRQSIIGSGYSQVNTMGIVACKSAYKDGYVWLEEMKAYLCGNLNFVREFVNKRLPQIKLIEPEGTYLVWLDCKAFELDDKRLNDLIINKAGLWLDSGSIFGLGGSGFQRINIACPRLILEKALLQLEQAIKSIT